MCDVGCATHTIEVADILGIHGETYTGRYIYKASTTVCEEKQRIYN